MLQKPKYEFFLNDMLCQNSIIIMNTFFSLLQIKIGILIDWPFQILFVCKNYLFRLDEVQIATSLS